MSNLARLVAVGLMAIAVGCAASQPKGPTGLRPTYDRICWLAISTSRKRICVTSGMTQGPWMAASPPRRKPRCAPTKHAMDSRSRGCWIGRLVWNWSLGWTIGG